MDRVALVTGASRGLGAEVSQRLFEAGYHVALACRTLSDGEALAHKWDPSGKKVFAVSLDMADERTYGPAVSQVLERCGRIDVLVNNAGILPGGLEGGNTLATPRADLRAAMEVNTFGAFQLAALVLPTMKKQNFGRIVNVSSGMGQLSDMGSGHVAYRLSKAALNAVTRILAAETKGSGILVNSVCPGWVRTDMGGASAHRSLEQGGRSILWAALLKDGGPTGGFFRDGEPLPW